MSAAYLIDFLYHKNKKMICDENEFCEHLYRTYDIPLHRVQ